MMNYSSFSKQKVGMRWLIASIVIGVVMCIIIGLMVGLLKTCPEPEVPQPQPTPTAPPTATTESGGTTQQPGTTTPDPSQPWLQMRLPTYFRPTHYRVRLTPSLGAATADGYTGQVDIHMNVTQATATLLVHYKFLAILSTEVMLNDVRQTLSNTFNYTTNQFWVIQLQQQLPAQSQIVVKMNFRGYYRGIVGLYNSSYVESGVTRHLATTKFQPTDARKAFPCLDEPQLKATYSVELVHPPDYTALSNMPSSGSEAQGDMLLTKFQDSRPMSTYLFCILISQFGNITSNTTDGTPFRVWAPAARIGQAKYALDTGIVIQDHFSNYLDSPYGDQMPKQDMAAIPDFPSGAMEHWGLITYRDTAMLFDNETGSAGDKQRVITIVAHELAHMWFGNMVTMVWWNDLWLNEGFASFFANRGADVFERDWQLVGQAVVGTYNSAFNADDSISSHPIIVDVNTPQEITQIFDTITYSKGHAIITQLEDFVGEINFRDGLRDYMKTKAYDVASTPELYESLQKFSTKNVTAFMETWTMQMGFPVLTVLPGANDNQIQLQQEWYLRDPSERSRAPPSPFNYQWQMDIKYGNSNATKQEHMLFAKQGVITVDNYKTMQPPLKFNLGQRGYFRVNYPDEDWRAIGRALAGNVESYPPVDRAGLIGDAFALGLSNQLSYAVITDFVAYMSAETEYLPWLTARSSLTFINRLLRRRATYGSWKSFMINVTSAVYDKMEFTPQTRHLDRLLQPIVLSLACGAGNPKCLAEAQRLFVNWRDNNVSVNAEQSSIVYTYGLLSDDTESNWNFLLSKYIESDTAADKERLLSAMAQTKNAWLIARLLDLSRDRSLVRSQDFVTLIGYIGANPNALEQLWAWSRANWVSLLNEFGDEDRRLGAMIPNFARNFNDAFHLQEYQSFIDSTEPGAGSNARLSTLSEIRSNIDWISTNEQELISSISA